MQNLVYKTFELNTDIEHFAKPINISGATTIRLTNIPSNVKCWISTESNGTNLYPLINRGDGWSNLPNPLYNLYIYTQGTTIDNEKIILNYTGQNDFFIYGNNSSERIDRIGVIDSFNDKALIQLNNAIFNTYSKVKPIIQCFLTGELHFLKSADMFVAHLPFDSIASLNLSNDDYYRIQQIGHFDLGRNEDNIDSSNTNSISAHLCAFKNTAGATFTPNTTQQFKKLFTVNKNPWLDESTDLFDIWGLKFLNALNGSSIQGNTFALEDKGLNYHSQDFIIKGEMLNNYDNFGIFWKVAHQTKAGSLKSHSSLLLTISKAYSNILG